MMLNIGDILSCQFGPHDCQLVLIEGIYQPCSPSMYSGYEYLVRDLSRERRARVPDKLLLQPWQCAYCDKPFPTDAQCQEHEQYGCISCNCQSLDQITHHQNSAKDLWPIYKAKYNKSYDTADDKKHFEIFNENVSKIAEHNHKFDMGEEENYMVIGRGAGGDDDDDDDAAKSDNEKKTDEAGKSDGDSNPEIVKEK